MVKCVSSAFLLHSTLFFLHCGKIVYVYVYLGIEVDIFSVMGGCVCVRGQGETDVYKEKTHNIVGGVYVYSQCGQSKGTVPRDI